MVVNETEWKRLCNCIAIFDKTSCKSRAAKGTVVVFLLFCTAIGGFFFLLFFFRD